MDEKGVIRISEGVYWIGIRDWNRRIFDALIPLPKGTSYNAYLVIGSKSSALIDTANPGFEKDLEDRIGSIINPKEIDYVIMNHAEPDHAGAIPHMMKVASKSRLVATARGSKMAQIYYHVPPDRIKVVADNEAINLGDKTLRFIEAPMLHWPETMFTYLEEDEILFPCDFFGSHLAGGVYSDEVEDLSVHAQRYWGEIMMPYRIMAQKALDKISGLKIKMIAPSHGPLHRKPEIILGLYKRWAAGETKRKTAIIYVSMWGSTDAMIGQMAETLMMEGIELAFHNLVVADIGEVAKDLVDSRAVVIGAPTVLGGAHPLAIYAAHLFKALRPPTKFAAILSSYGWGGGAVKQIQEIIRDLKVEIVGALEINGPPTEENLKQISDLARSLAKRIVEEG